MKLYIAGPMRGIPEFNFPAFEEATVALRAAGHTVFSPHEKDLDVPGFDPKDPASLAALDLGETMRADLRAVLDADAIVMLKGWHKSSGARLERVVAESTGRMVYQFVAERPGEALLPMRPMSHEMIFAPGRTAAMKTDAAVDDVDLERVRTICDRLAHVERHGREGVLALDGLRRMVAVVAESAGERGLIPHLWRQMHWSENTFGPGNRWRGVVDHIRKELIEIEAKPDDLGEWIDVMILAFDGAMRIGANPHDIVRALIAKQDRNEARVWPDWRLCDPSKAIEHKREVV